MIYITFSLDRLMRMSASLEIAFLLVDQFNLFYFRYMISITQAVVCTQVDCLSLRG